MENLLLNYLYQVLSVVAVFYAFGLILWLFNMLFYRMLGGSAYGFCVATGFLGTPVHELGHAFFCLIFFHKIKEIRLFRPNKQDGVLGYVSHSYSKRNVYQQIGNFFIGIGPILFGSAVLFLLMYLLIPSTFESVFSSARSATLDSFFAELWETVKTIFSGENLGDYKWWIFIVLASLITIHMTLSPADVKGSLVGTLYILILLLIVNVALYFLFPSFQNQMTNWLINKAVVVASLLSFAVIVAVMVDLITFVINMIIKVFKK